MSGARPSDEFFIGWDVGGWNCDHNASSRDAIVISDAELTIAGKPWRGNFRTVINESPTTKDFIASLFSLCTVDPPTQTARFTLAIDTPLGFSSSFIKLVTGFKYVEPVESSHANPYLFRQTERYLFERGLKPLSAIKDMIGSQATKGMHVLAKFAPEIERCGVWSDNELLTAIEAYPSACKKSQTIAALRHRVKNQPHLNQDTQDALTCALMAYLFRRNLAELISPIDCVPVREGWIWVPNDIFKGSPP